MTLPKSKIYKIIELLVTFILGVASVLLVESCTVSMSVSKNNQNSTQKTEQTSSSSVDSTRVEIER